MPEQDISSSTNEYDFNIAKVESDNNTKIRLEEIKREPKSWYFLITLSIIALTGCFMAYLYYSYNVATLHR